MDKIDDEPYQEFDERLKHVRNTLEERSAIFPIP